MNVAIWIIAICELIRAVQIVYDMREKAIIKKTDKMIIDAMVREAKEQDWLWK